MSFPVFHSAKEWSARLGEARPATTLTVGNFDGLHLGHQRLLRTIVDTARASQTMAAAITFDPHPLKILRPDSAPPLIAPISARLTGFQQLGLAAALVLQFDAAFSRTSPEEFVEHILVQALRVRTICVGENFRFGHRHAGDVSLLRRLGEQRGFQVQIVAPVMVRGQVVSSTAIRAAVSEGRVGHAARLLGRPFTLRGSVQPGSGNGQRLLVPTLNLSTDQQLLPGNGVYATETVVAGRKYPSATNVGFRPTLDGKRFAIESHLLGFAAEIREGPMEVHFWRRLRDEKKFASVDALREQIARDVARAEAFFRRLSVAETRGLSRAVRRQVDPNAPSH